MRPAVENCSQRSRWVELAYSQIQTEQNRDSAAQNVAASMTRANLQENIDSTSENSPSKSSTGSYLKCIHHGQMGRMRVSGLWQDDGTEVPIGTPQMVALLIKPTYSRYNQVSQRSSCNPITSHCYHSVSGSSLLFCGLAELLLRPRIAVAASTGTRSSMASEPNMLNL
jgi:hypothetical protein